MRALLLLVALAVPAHADDDDVDVSFVTGELRGTTAVVQVRYSLQLHGPMHAMGAAFLSIPSGAAATRVVVNGVHRLALVDAKQAEAKLAALGSTTGAKRWAVLVEAQGSGALELSYAVPHDTRLILDVELQMPTCYYRDARHVQLPAEWRPRLAPQLRRRFGKELGKACRDEEEVFDDELWVSFPSAELARRPAGIERVGANAVRIDLGDAHVARLEVAIAERLGEVPRDLATAILVDGSRSMSTGALEAQREIVKAYARAAGDTQLQLIAYARTAQPLLPSWMTARTAAARIDRALRAIAPRNGSNVDAGFAEAARWLAQHTGTKRVVLVTDEQLSRDLRARFDTLAKLLPAGTLVHVIAADDAGDFDRDSHGLGVTLAESTGGIAVRSGVREAPIDATMLLRPIRIDELQLTTPGWKPLANATTCKTSLEEGRGCVWWGEGAAVAGPVALEGKLWGKRISRVVTPDPRREAELARELAGMNILEERAQERAQKKARAAGSAFSFYAEWGGAGGYLSGSFSISGGHCCHRSGHAFAGPQVRVGHSITGRSLPVVDLSPQFAHVVGRCGLGTTHVEATIELTGVEIVDVSVLAPPDAVRCVEDAIWDTAITPPDPRMFRTSPRIVLVH